MLICIFDCLHNCSEVVNIIVFIVKIQKMNLRKSPEKKNNKKTKNCKMTKRKQNKRAYHKNFKIS